jgi:hypothetical protein
LPVTFSRFDEAYGDSDSATIRGYVSDLATSDADVAWLSRHVGRRMFALPLPGPDDGGGRRDVGDPAQRRALVEAEFGGCTPPAGLTSEQFVAAAFGVIEELWGPDADEIFQAANHLSLQGVPRHDIIHRLAGTPGRTVGASLVS